MKRGTPLKRGLPKKRGPAADAWKEFRDRLWREEAPTHCDRCGLPAGGLDLHHIVGRRAAPRLIYERGNLTWLCRWCHDEAHN